MTLQLHASQNTNYVNNQLCMYHNSLIDDNKIE